ncbi:MAG: aminotransferase class IV [Acidobacteriota bacterium]
MVVWYNGRFVPDGQVGEMILTPALRQARGVFSTLLLKAGKAVWLEEHIKRLENSAQELFRLVLHSSEIRKAALEWPKYSNITDGIMRLVVWEEKGQLAVLVLGDKVHIEQQASPVKLQQSYCIRHTSDITVRHKTFSRLILELECERAINEGFDEALFLNEHGAVTETSKHNFFFVRDGIINTPCIDCGLLPGIGRMELMCLAQENDMEVKEGFYTLEEVLRSDEAFVINAVRGVIPVAVINDREWSVPGPKTKELAAMWRDAVEREVLR